MSVVAEGSRLRPLDVLRVGTEGLCSRRLRTVLAGLGIAIGIAAIVTILGLSASSQANLLARLDRIGTNLLTAKPGQDMFGSKSRLPATARAGATGIDGVTGASSVAAIDDVTVRASPYVPDTDTGGIAVAAADPNLARTLGVDLAQGRFLDPASARMPSVVLGATAARRLGVTAPGAQVYVADRWLTVVGIMQPVLLDPALDTSALISFRFARSFTDVVRSPTTVYVRTVADDVGKVRELLAPSVKPQAPDEVQISRPSDAVAARAEAKSAFTGLFLGLGAVALLVGGLGIANVMVISVLERRGEIGLRRAIGATRRHIALQFVCESLLLSVFGGLAGSALGAAGTVAFAVGRGWGIVIPIDALVAGVGGSVAIGVIAGAYPALRAARLPPTEALRAA
jgi:putative ABC transport system permease protein